MGEIVIPGLDRLDQIPNVDLPPISHRYAESLAKLVLIQEAGVTHFQGGPLDLSHDRDVWMSPVVVNDGGETSYFQLFYAGTRPYKSIKDGTIPTTLLDIDDTSFKLTPGDHPSYRQLMGQFTDNEAGPHIVIRPCKSGIAYFPMPVTPNQDANVLDEHKEILLRALGLHEPDVNVGLAKPSKRNKGVYGEGEIEGLTQTTVFSFNGRDIYSYGVVLPEDPWKYYEVYSPRPWQLMPEDNLLVRIDSGCDTGQLFSDRGCDCREQLHTALSSMISEGDGMIIHIPGQDGRGYGSVTKMDTELQKRGLGTARGPLRSVESVDTVVAAQRLLGPNFDIRSYTGAGKILQMMRVRGVRLMTDNKRKVDGILGCDIDVTRVKTGTVGKNGCERHIKAKHELDMYFDDTDDDDTGEEPTGS